MSPFVARALAPTLVVLALSTAAHATTVVIQPSNQDAFVTQDKPNRIAGAGPNNTRIRVQASPPNTQVRRGLVEFDLSGIPTGATISSAIVELYAANTSNVALTHGVHRITQPWLQSTVKWNNQPAFVALATATAVVGPTTGFKSFDVTADVQGFVNVCSSEHGWVVKDQAETATSKDINYVALEENHIPDIPNRPKLTVTFTPPPCTVDADCADDNECTINEHCDAGVCVTQARSCNDSDPCTDDICDCSIGCVNSPICNDGFACTTDTCDPMTLECTNTPVQSVCNTDCASGTCVADPDRNDIDSVTGCLVATTEPDGTPCSDQDQCTLDDACLSGACVSGSTITCGNGMVEAGCGEDCDGGFDCDAECHFICGPTPDPSCKVPAVAGKGSVNIKDNVEDDDKDIIGWKWVKGAETTVAELGTPAVDTTYTLCVYDGSGSTQPIVLAQAPAGGTCGDKPCWKQTKDGGFKYKNKAVLPDGVLLVKLKPGVAEKAKMLVKAKGEPVVVPSLPLTTPVTVQLKNGDVCWSSTFTTPKKTTATQFKSKSSN